MSAACVDNEGNNGSEANFFELTNSGENLENINAEDVEFATEEPNFKSSTLKRKVKKNFGNKIKKRKVSNVLKTALMRLNEDYKGLVYTIQNVGGPPHQPVFKATVIIESQSFEGEGKSKQFAKLAAANAAFGSMSKLQDMEEKDRIVRYTQDVLQGNIVMETSSGGNGVAENKENSNGNKGQAALHKNPVMLLNEMIPGLQYVCVEETGTGQSKVFTMTIEHEKEVYSGNGSSKKAAKAAAAAEMLLVKFNIEIQTFGNHSDFSMTDLPAVPVEFTDKVGRIVNDAFDDIMLGIQQFKKQKVLAGIVMINNKNQQMKLICVSSGTKCISGGNISENGKVLNDCHAEIISRRCLIDYLITELENRNTNKKDSIFHERAEGKLALNPDIKFHLYISTAPCGDSRIFSPKEVAVDNHPERKSRGLLRTKIEAGEGTIPVGNLETSVQTWDSILAGKQLFTMSCSDKISRWMVCGLQGAILSHLIDPIYLESITLGSLFNADHMYRALVGRYSSNLGELPDFYEHRSPAMGVTSNKVVRQVSKAPGFSVNWTSGSMAPEIVQAVTGKTTSDSASRICKNSLFSRFNALKKHYSQLKDVPLVYSEAKSSATDYQTAKRQFNEAVTKCNLGHWMKKPVEQDQFTLS